MVLFSLIGDNYVATLTLGGAGAHATYYHKANDQVQSCRNEIDADLFEFGVCYCFHRISTS